MKYILPVICLVLALCAGIIAAPAHADDGDGDVPLNSEYATRVVDRDGCVLYRMITPARPPAQKVPSVSLPENTKTSTLGLSSNVKTSTVSLTDYTQTSVLSLGDVPAFNWSYGCSATAAAMLFGYYDRVGYSNFYTGPTDGGLCPLNNSVWGAGIGGSTGQCPISATRNGLDSRVTRGSVDDYWISYGSAGPDPYVGHWAEHSPYDCTADFMGTSQWRYYNTDGSTSFYLETNGIPLYDYTGCEPGDRDGCHGVRLFAESRGYTVLSNYTQATQGGYYNPPAGFTFADYKAEIDAGRPVIIQVLGHSMLGFGYNDTGTLIYLHDTWDYSNHQMTWGGYYYNMRQWGVTVVQLAPAGPASITVTSPNGGETWASGSSHAITWTSSNMYGSINIALSRDGGTTYTDIISNTPNDGSQAWTVTSPDTAQAMIKVYGASNSTVFDESDAAFAIVTPAAVPVLVLPTTGSVQSTLTPALDWNDSANALTYGIQVSSLSNFTSTVVNQAGLGVSTFTVPGATLNWNTLYYWRANAANAAGNSAWSAARYFRTATGPPPAAPSNLTATLISSTRINLTWDDNSAGETGFRIERKKGAGAFAQIALVGPNITAYSNATGLMANINYTYRVRAYIGTLYSLYSNEANVTTLPPPPAAPALISPAHGAISSTLTPVLDWNEPAGAVSYGLQISSVSNFTTMVVNQTGLVTSTYTVPGATLNWNTLYYWRVNATNASASTSGWSGIRALRTAIGPPPDAPSNLVSTSVLPSRIDLAWDDNSAGETGFRIERKKGAGAFAQIATVGAGVKAYSNVSGLTANTAYTYRVRAYQGTTLNSLYSNEANATTAPATPALVSPANGAANQSLNPILDWSETAGSATWGVQVSTNYTFTGIVVNQSGLVASNYTVPGATLNPSTLYYWRANSTNGSGSTSAWSAYRYFRTAP